MPGFQTIVPESRLDDFVASVRRKTPRTYTDITTPAHPVFTRMEQAGAVKTEDGGMAPVRGVMYATPDRTITLSRSKPFKDRLFTPIETKTAAAYHWIMWVTTLTIPQYTYLNATSGPQMVNYVQGQMDALDVQLQNKMVDAMWNGYTEGDEKIWGLKDLIRFDPSTDPARGKVGGIGVADLPDWKNQSKNYDNPAFEYDSGARVRTFLTNGTNSLSALYLACSNNPDGTQKQGQPNLFAVNQQMYLFMQALAESGKIFRDGNTAMELATDGFMYKGAAVYYDNDCPDDPNNSEYGVGFLINTNALDWTWASGLKKVWGTMEKLQSKTGFAWEETSQGTMCASDLRRSGVIYGVKPIDVA